ncbi:amino acid permease [Amycolatopsis rhabdoformis]|uniref:Amino acid permease n=1 Tax=Amycolatopsis rhabdoformis TaxID=1448059 RepID=A0ABZ1I0P6_9PSEU|nr:amino acid permease [Amycolatopsis rhabdoformis]WSE27987.1 amino acid permease [Amycolatopsis rhabdoformis]
MSPSDRTAVAEPPETAFKHEEAGYHKGLKNRQVQMIAIGGAIGTGLFLGAGSRLHSTGPALAVVYAIAGIVAFFVVRAMGELVMHRPSSGSFVSYSREFLGEKAAFFAGWMYFLNWATAGVADVTAVAKYTQFFWPDLQQWIPALIALFAILAVNMVSVKLFGELEFWFAAVKVLALVVFMVVAIFVLISRTPVDGVVTGPSLISGNGGLFPTGVLPALLILQGVVFAYSGVEMVGVTAGETANPRKVIPKAVNSVAWRIGIFYVGSVLLLVMVLPWTAYKSGESPFVTFFSKLGIPAAGGIMDVIVLTAALSSVNSGLYSTGRILRSLSVAGSAPKFTSRMSKSGVPYGGVLLTAAVYVLGVVLNLVVPGEAFEVALEFSALGIIGMWSMIVICHLAMTRKAARGEMTRPGYRLPGAPYTNYVTLAFLLLVLTMSWWGGTTGRILIYSIPILAIVLVVGWLGVRGRVRRIAAERADVAE